MAAPPSPENHIPMPRACPAGTTDVRFEGLGTAKGFIFPDGVRQVWGIPYGRFEKRWTLSKLVDSWENGFHDGTKHGAVVPMPGGYNPEDDPLFPMPALPHLPAAPICEKESLVMNITLPPAGASAGPLPVMVFIHGGSFVYGGADHHGYDCTNLVSYSMLRGTPVILVTFNYRVGLFGFLASKAIKADLAKSGYPGVGNFGLLDQQVALEWVQKYIPALGGDKDNVTIFGESAGGVSVAHQIYAHTPAVFHRAILMSGNFSTISAWPLEKHEKRYLALLRHLKIDPDAHDALEQLRSCSYEAIRDATIPIEGGHGFIFANPCDDGVFQSDVSYDRMGKFPAFLKSVMIGHVRDEGWMWRMQLAGDSYEYYLEHFLPHMTREQAELVLNLYGITPDVPAEEVRLRFEKVIADAAFVLPDVYSVHNSNKTLTFGYHMDQESTFDNFTKGTAYHAIDLPYVFLTFSHVMTPGQLRVAYSMAGHWIDLACGREPWERFGENQRWMVYGPTDQVGLKTEAEDEAVRGYERMKKVQDIGLSVAFAQAAEECGMRTWALGTTL